MIVQQTAHSLKSSSATVGASALFTLCRELENVGKSGELTPAKPLLVDAVQAFAALQISLQTEFVREGEIAP